jgi:MoaA/NifB/PqqE/SkfB family radical SAM enzyme
MTGRLNYLQSYQAGNEFRALFEYLHNEVGTFKSFIEMAKVGITTLLPYRGLSPIMGPVYVGFDRSYECNCRCSFCDRWKMVDKSQELTTDEILNLSHQLKEVGAHLVCIAGGEPTKQEDMPAIVSRFHQDGLKVTICTNGYRLAEMAEDLIVAGVDHVTVSLDGLPESHDKIRGVKGLYRKAEAGIERVLQKRRPDSKPTVNVRMLVHENNLDEIPWFVKKWNKTADSVLVQPLHNGTHNFYKVGGDIQVVKSTEKLRAILAKTTLGNNFYNRALPNYLENPSKFEQLPCYAGYWSCRIDPFGNLFGCVEQICFIGNLRMQSFENLWKSAAFARARKGLSKNKKCSCFYNDAVLLNSYGWLFLDKIPLLKRIIRAKFNGKSVAMCAAPSAINN